MKIIRSNDLPFVPASHEDPRDPGVLKKILFQRNDLIEGNVQMINWALLPPGKSFRSHLHESMDEIIIMLSGEAQMTIESESETLTRGDAVIVPMKAIHEMKNTGTDPVEYIVLGIVQKPGGKTIVTT